MWAANMLEGNWKLQAIPVTDPQSKLQEAGSKARNSTKCMDACDERDEKMVY